jgi:uncharacterized protein with HEPN domain
VKGDRLYLHHILEAIEKIEGYITVGRDVFRSSSHWQDAVVRQLEIIGEATTQSRIFSLVIPAKAGIQACFQLQRSEPDV